MPNSAFPFDYEVPRRLVAQEPLRNRADARLMVVDRRRQSIDHHHIRDLPHLLEADDRLVLNDTKVIPAQLAGVRSKTGGRWQGLFIETTPDGNWRILCKTRGRLEPGETVMLRDREGRPAQKLWLIERLEEGQWLAHAESEEPASALLDRLGRVPLPPYIRGGNMVDEDVANYQTVFARRPGAIAAPTAGLHFTPELIERCREAGARIERVELDVGLDTFRPVSDEDPREHRIHTEHFRVPGAVAEAVESARSQGGRVIAVGTTSVRALESAWDPDMDAVVGTEGSTSLYILPGYRFRAVDAVITNFHVPRSTLLMMMSAFAGRELLMRAYGEALDRHYRFLSFGDAMLIV